MSTLMKLVAGVALGAVVSGAAIAEDYTLRFNHVLGPGELFHEGFLSWAAKVDERTNGRLKIEVFHSAQLGVEEDIIEQIRQGANIGQNTDSARLGTFVPGIAVVNGPYLVANKEEAYKLADSPTMQGWLDQLAADHGIRVVCFDWVQGERHFFTNKPIRSPEDLAGQRIRTPPAPIWQESIRALGAEPVAMAFGDVYSGLQNKAIDGAELVYSNITARNMNEVLNHANETAHILLVNFQIVSEQWYKDLPEDIQSVLVEECRGAGQATSDKIATAQDEAKQKLIDAGMTVVEDIDREAFVTAGAKAFEVLGLTDAVSQIRADMSN
ncbi:MAG: C4-dicarboxylate TRAP transporter substrate-binding protein [Desulfomicrobium sp.]|uniref:C4-dicarboxylate TRAP transporter substrate-binding protein n=1 Tax=Hoeflea sp. TaxID=1940281 RepID=UPI0025BE7712|nr:C4-dicarboxylate TRAP transporter substrate-binding protein [Hoeflea sp.]MBV1713141.1 C4-dicarboxylate TRAP transporter substrate-binding protein [Desulfomicrobium sp.]MBV1785064.1 C4-dicarboxylate TRAP transporter substrate-binding protein [Hoeflea sp.]